MYRIYVRYEVNSPYVRYGREYRDKLAAMDAANKIDKPAEVRDGINNSMYHNQVGLDPFSQKLHANIWGRYAKGLRAC